VERDRWIGLVAANQARQQAVSENLPPPPPPAAVVWLTPPQVFIDLSYHTLSIFFLFLFYV
jgi:hypothetical protein